MEESIIEQTRTALCLAVSSTESFMSGNGLIPRPGVGLKVRDCDRVCQKRCTCMFVCCMKGCACVCVGAAIQMTL